MFTTPPNFNKGSSCGQCKGEDTMNMVQCDNCDTWYHFKCVGVTQSIENKPWKCSKCDGQTSKPNIENMKKPKQIENISKRDQQDNIAEGEVKMPVKNLTMSIKSSATAFRKSKKAESVSFKGTIMSSHQSKIDLELKQLEEEKALEIKFLQRKFEILAKSEKDCQSVCSDVSQRSARTRQWVSDLPEEVLQEKPLQVAYKEMTHARSLSKSEIAARQVLSKELPTFSGKPEEWPVFFSNFEESTKLCGFSDSENLLRLQRSLKGKAYDLVSSQLLIPRNVPEILRTLRMMFGRPEIIINNLIEKIRSEPSPKAEKLETIISYALSVRNLCSSLEASGMTSHLKNPLLMQELVSKLPAQTRLNWSLYIGDREADVIMFSSWLFSLAEAATRVSNMCPLSRASNNLHVRDNLEKSIDSANLHAHDNATNFKHANDEKFKQRQRKCFACESLHSLPKCQKFASLKLYERWNIVKNNKLCRICLQKHGNFRCSDDKCSVQGCEARHNKLLHKFIHTPPTVSTHLSPSNFERHNTTYFKIIPVVLYHNERSIEVFAFLDDGSNVTLLEEDVLDFLELEGESKPLCLNWTANTKRVEENSMNINLSISGNDEGATKYKLYNVQTVKELALPTQTVDDKLVKYYKHLEHLPIETYTNAVPKILIGLKNGHLCNTLKLAEGLYNEPCASKTRLGWVIHGGGEGCSDVQNVYHIHTCDCNYEFEKLQQLISEHFSLESTGKPYELKSAEDERAGFLLESTTKRIGNRFETGLLWKDDNLDVPESYNMALKRLQCLERKLKSDELDFVTQQIASLVSKGYARKLTANEVMETNERIWYLPIFTVTNPNKPNKIRLVWDAAAKVNGTSLNTMLLKGPDLMASLLSVLYGFRMKKIAISADIKEMFHQVKIRKKDQNAQRFLWRNKDSSRNPDVYVMEVMTFGAVCSPSSAQFVKNKNALEFKESHSRAVDSILYHHYVDDLLDCADSEEAAIQLAREVAYIHQEGGFFIRNFKSNSVKVLQNLKDLEENGTSNENCNIELSTEKVLGMWWNTETDEFTFSLKLNRLNKEILSGTKKPTKLDILRTLMSIFDPFGFLSPFVIYIKILLQEVWRTTEGWNSYVNENIFQKWLVWIKLLPKIESVKIPRWYNFTNNFSIQLHVFVDASEQAYAAVAYFRIECNNKVICKLVSAKTKVAPKQPISIPRMELLAAVQGTRLAATVSKMHNLQFSKRCFWSDSNTVLSWINSEARNYKQFVMFRIGEILETTESYEWRYIPTKINVADDATKWKGAKVFDLENSWFQGPSFLIQEEVSWPNNVKFGKSEKELRPHIVMLHAGESPSSDTKFIQMKRFSSWIKVLQMVCALYKFASILKHEDLTRSHLISKAENFLYRLIQADAYKDEIALLRKGFSLNKTSPLYKCSAYLDEASVIRIKGRIDMANVNEYTKRPIILPRDHYGTKLIIQHYHERYYHVQHDTCLNEIRQKFYISRLRSELKKIRAKCQHCKNSNSIPVVPEMASLPNARLSAFVRPFSYVGIDYFGPLYVTVGRHKEKRWGVIFTCMTIRAVHIEVARDLTTDSCIIVIQNFIARRGTPLEIYSDNGTNLRGAESELKKAVLEINYNQLELKFTNESTTWHFNPPASPHMGGCWERLIRTIKKILYKISPQFSFRDDTLVNALIECERIINSRPLTYVELESVSDEALTPNHFLLGSSNGQKPLGEFTERDGMLRKNWRKLQFFANLFWKRWVQEYLPTLTKRTKWFKKERDLTVDDIVVIVDPNLPRNNWPLGIVLTVHKGMDGNVRSAAIKTKDGVFTRPAAKLARLDVRTSEN